MLWLEEPSWDPVNAAPISVTPENITLELNGAYTTITAYQFDDTGNVSPIDLTMSTYYASLTVTDQLTIVQIDQGTGDRRSPQAHNLSVFDAPAQDRSRYRP